MQIRIGDENMADEPCCIETQIFEQCSFILMSNTGLYVPLL